MAKKTSTGITELSPEIHFRAGDYVPTDFFNDTANVPYTSEAEFEVRLENIKGKIRSVLIAQENLTLVKELHKAEGLAIDANNQRSKNAIKLETGRTLGVQLQQEQTKTSIESAKLTELRHDLSGYTSQASLKQQTWNMKIDGLKVDIEKAKILLDRKKEELNAMKGLKQLAS